MFASMFARARSFHHIPNSNRHYHLRIPLKILKEKWAKYNKLTPNHKKKPKEKRKKNTNGFKFKISFIHFTYITLMCERCSFDGVFVYITWFYSMIIFSFSPLKMSVYNILNRGMRPRCHMTNTHFSLQYDDDDDRFATCSS